MRYILIAAICAIAMFGAEANGFRVVYEPVVRTVMVSGHWEVIEVFVGSEYDPYTRRYYPVYRYDEVWIPPYQETWIEWVAVVAPVR